jgi:hypothetical protein
MGGQCLLHNLVVAQPLESLVTQVDGIVSTGTQKGNSFTRQPHVGQELYARTSAGR